MPSRGVELNTLAFDYWNLTVPIVMSKCLGVRRYWLMLSRRAELNILAFGSWEPHGADGDV